VVWCSVGAATAGRKKRWQCSGGSGAVYDAAIAAEREGERERERERLHRRHTIKGKTNQQKLAITDHSE
jgi:hypothetical protein